MNPEVRSYNPWIWLVLPLWCLAFSVLFPPHQFDVAVSRLFWIDGNWFWHDNTFFSQVLHKGVAIVPIVIMLYVICRMIRLGLQKSEVNWQEKSVRYGYVIFAMLVSVLLCWWLKQTTDVSCPSNIVEFGGTRPIAGPDWSIVFRQGNCWPGGHSGSAFSLFALYFALRDRCKFAARCLLGAVLVFGMISSAVCTMQGEGFVSHHVATLLIDWIVCATIYVLVYDRSNIFERFKNTKPATHFIHTLIGTALFWTLYLDVPFWRALFVSAGSDPQVISQTLFLAVVLALSFFFVALAVIELLGLLPRRLFQLMLIILGLSGVTALIASLLYGTTMTPDMLRNFLQTDAREASMYFSVSTVLLFVFLFGPVLLLIHTAEQGKILLSERFKRLGLSALFLLVGVLILASQLQPFSALMRNDKSLRYMIAPFNTVYSTASTLLRDQNTDAKRVRVVVDPNPRASLSPARATLFVLVIGETARSANWQLAGYEKATNPMLSTMDILNIPKVEACGTSTDVSLPCMLSRVGRRDYDRDRILSEEALPSLLQRSGLNVTWIDNQSGSKGTSDGVKTIRLSDDKALCGGGECMDMAFVEDLKKRLKTIRAGDRQVLILHQMGSHGPAYDLRSEDSDKVFGKVCTDPSFRSCSAEEIVSAYDASIRYTDRVLAGLINELKAHSEVNTALLYISDHGESLGENGLFLHGAPYRISPDVQKVVPMVMWLSSSFKSDYGVSEETLQKNATSQSVTHDHLYHTVLGLLKVKSSTYEVRWDLSAQQTR